MWGGGGGGRWGRGRLRYYSECFNWCFTIQIFISVRESTSYMYSVVFYRTGLYSTAHAEPKREFRVRGLALASRGLAEYSSVSSNNSRHRTLEGSSTRARARDLASRATRI